MNRLKIIPLLVFVAMLAFSVRVADFVSDLSAFSGAAHAESETHAKDEQEEQHEGGHAGGDEEHDEDKGQSLVFSESDEGEGIDWRDPGDEDPGYTAIRMEIFEDLSKRRQELEEREQQLGVREALLKAATQELDRKYHELSQLRQQIEGLLETQSEEEKARTESLVKIYEGMKPKDAARIFDTLDLDILVSVVSQMSERKLSPIMAGMNPERARTITIMLAEQKRLPSLPHSN